MYIDTFRYSPHARHDEESRLAHCFKGTEKSADNDQVRESRAGSVQSQNRPPDHDADAEEFSNGNTLDGVVDRVFHDQDGNVDTGSQPREQLSAHEVEVLLKTHDAREGHGALVEGLQEVGEDHD